MRWFSLPTRRLRLARCEGQPAHAADGDPLAAMAARARLTGQPWEFIAMRYRVRFFKNLLCLDGSVSRCLQQSIVIRRAKSVDRAVEAGKRRYERLCEVADWQLHADGVELEIDLQSRVR